MTVGELQLVEKNGVADCMCERISRIFLLEPLLNLQLFRPDSTIFPTAQSLAMHWTKIMSAAICKLPQLLANRTNGLALLLMIRCVVCLTLYCLSVTKCIVTNSSS